MNLSSRRLFTTAVLWIMAVGTLPLAATGAVAHSASGEAQSNPPVEERPQEGEPESTPDFDIGQLQLLLKRDHASTADFTEHQYRKVLSRPIESKGRLYFEPPNIFERRVTVPRAEKYRIEGETLTMETPGHKVRRLSLRSQPLLHGLMLGFQAVVSGDLDLLAPYYHLAVSGSPEEWRLELDPTDRELARRIQKIAVDGRQGDALHFEVTERSGDRLVTDIRPRT